VILTRKRGERSSFRDKVLRKSTPVNSSGKGGPNPFSLDESGSRAALALGQEKEGFVNQFCGGFLGGVKSP